MEINVLSLFDGMSCGYLALDRAEIGVGTYYASEIDKYAQIVSEAKYPDIVRMGDITNWRNWSIDWSSIDLLIAGSPCQGFSFAGKQLAFDDPRSTLFFVFVDILNHIKSLNPNVKFLLENVRMKKEHLNLISDYVGVSPVLIDSSSLSAQKRQRYYWANWSFDAPEESTVVLSDILEHGVTINDKSYCLDANDFKGSNPRLFLEKSRRQLVFLGADEKGLRLKDGKYYSRNFREGYRIYSVRGLASALTAKSKGGPGGYSGLYGDVINDTVYYRKLTPVECERLQTVPDNYTEGVSNTQRYKMLGNGWTVDVIAHILKAMPFR